MLRKKKKKTLTILKEIEKIDKWKTIAANKHNVCFLIKFLFFTHFNIIF